LAFEVRIKKSALKDLQGLTKEDQERVLDDLESKLSKDPYKGKTLSGEFKGLHRWRAGRFRIIYEIQQQQLVVLVLRIGHRKDIYR
jgi:mRNA interferase RelE/StbE